MTRRKRESKAEKQARKERERDYLARNGLPRYIPRVLARPVERQFWQDLVYNLSFLDQVFEGINVDQRDLELMLQLCGFLADLPERRHMLEEARSILATLESQLERAQASGDQLRILEARFNVHLASEHAFGVEKSIQGLELQILTLKDELYLTPASRADLVRKPSPLDFTDIVDSLNQPDGPARRQ